MIAFTIKYTRHCYSNFTVLSTVLAQKWFHAQICKSGLQKWTCNSVNVFDGNRSKDLYEYSPRIVTTNHVTAELADSKTAVK